MNDRNHYHADLLLENYDLECSRKRWMIAAFVAMAFFILTLVLVACGRI